MLFLLSLPLLSLLYDLPSSTPVYFLGQSYFCFAKILLWMPAISSFHHQIFLSSFFCSEDFLSWQFPPPFLLYFPSHLAILHFLLSSSLNSVQHLSFNFNHLIAAFTLLLFLTLKVMLQINFQCALATFSSLISNYKLTIPSDALFDSTNLFTCSSFKMTPTLFLFLSTPWRKAKERS